MNATDIVDDAAALLPDSPMAMLRQQREAFVRHTQGSHDVLITPADPAGVSLIERAAVALVVASIEHDAALIAHYRTRLEAVGADRAVVAAANGEAAASGLPPRLAAILHHVSQVTTAPGMATRGDLDALRDAGLAPRDIVTITQIVAFVSYQVRVVTGLRALGQQARP